MFAQASTTISDGPGWGAAEWIALLSGATMLCGAITALVVQVVRMRRENTNQHAEGRALVTDVRDRLLDLHTTVERVDAKVDDVASNLHRHEEIHHRDRRRRW
jgi:uncharacterized protein YlxW (UPF0749 family)